jgi:hypothetical protein
MKYIRVKWKHDRPAAPALIYSELDTDQREQRRVEVFSDGHIGYVDKKQETGDTMLGLEPLPNLAKVAMDPQFEVSEISKEDFDVLWAGATK